MISKAQVKHIRSLEQKKKRLELGEFIAEGKKMIAELLTSSYTIKSLFATRHWAERQKAEVLSSLPLYVVEQEELQSISQLKTCDEVLAIIAIPEIAIVETGPVVLALDGIKDPGNLGSIIRIADWYGIDTILCNLQTADIYNPKVVQATMGSIFRVNCIYTDLKVHFQNHSDFPVYSCVMNGVNVNKLGKVARGIILIGNESTGISSELLEYSSYQISIPKKGKAESLNAAIATGIVCNALLS